VSLVPWDTPVGRSIEVKPLGKEQGCDATGYGPSTPSRLWALDAFRSEIRAVLLEKELLFVLEDERPEGNGAGAKAHDRARARVYGLLVLFTESTARSLVVQHEDGMDGVAA
jgi:hypothetical protein